MIRYWIVTLYLLISQAVLSQESDIGFISGQLEVDTTWDRSVYLSHIPTFEDQYAMSSEMIVSETIMDSLGNFTFDLSFLPTSIQLFRIHITKKGDSRASLIIGGNDENHLLFLANRESQIKLHCAPATPPFDSAVFFNSTLNNSFNQITRTANRTRQKASNSSAAKRRFIENKLREDLLLFADTVTLPLVSLYAVYVSGIDANTSEYQAWRSSFLGKWEKENNAYFKAFRNRIPGNDKTNYLLWSMGAFVLLSIGFLLGKFASSRKKKAINSLSVQERRVFELLKKGVSNQEISEECNIGISTVKSHVSNIYSKLNIKSRKDVMDF